MFSAEPCLQCNRRREFGKFGRNVKDNVPFNKVTFLVGDKGND